MDIKFIIYSVESMKIIRIKLSIAQKRKMKNYENPRKQ